MIMSGISVLQAMSTPLLRGQNNLNYFWMAYKNHQLVLACASLVILPEQPLCTFNMFLKGYLSEAKTAPKN